MEQWIGSWQNQPLKKAVYVMECLTRLMHALPLFCLALCSTQWARFDGGMHITQHAHLELTLSSTCTLTHMTSVFLRQNSATIEERLWFCCMILVHFLGLCFIWLPPLDYATFFYNLVQKSSKASGQLLSSMCRHDMVSEGLRRSFFFDCTFIL